MAFEDAPVCLSSVPPLPMVVQSYILSSSIRSSDRLGFVGERHLNVSSMDDFYHREGSILILQTHRDILPVLGMSSKGPLLVGQSSKGPLLVGQVYNEL